MSSLFLATQTDRDLADGHRNLHSRGITDSTGSDYHGHALGQTG
jgi:hypothetical protein